MPIGLTGSAICNTPDGKGIVLIGGYKGHPDYEKSSALIQLTGDSFQTLHWTVLSQKLQFPRMNHTAFPVPDIFTRIRKCCGSAKKNKPSRRRGGISGRP